MPSTVGLQMCSLTDWTWAGFLGWIAVTIYYTGAGAWRGVSDSLVIQWGHEWLRRVIVRLIAEVYLN